MTAIAPVQIEISPATPKPKPIFRLAITKSLVFRTSLILT
jgi:hypothetical protein